VLPPLPAGGPHTLTANDLTVRDVLIGEVWVCSGQSNMEWTLANANDGEAEIAASTDDGLRFFTVPKVAAVDPAVDVVAHWVPSSPATAGVFSAVGYFFARKLRAALGVPVGMLSTSWGGTPVEAWTSLPALEAEPAAAELIARYRREMVDGDADAASYRDRYAAWEREEILSDPENTGFARGWADPATDTATWPRMTLPTSWQAAGLKFNGVLWFRTEVDVPAAWAGRPLTLRIGAVDKSDTTYVNNVRVGGLSITDDPNAWCTPREYPVPGALVRAGRNVIAVRAFSNIYNGGLTGPDSAMLLYPEGEPEAALPLAGAWAYQVEHNFGLRPLTPAPPQPWGAGNPWTPGSLYHGMIAPLVPFGIRGAIWYQGESNADRPEQYRTLFPAMIRDWRARWGADFPFYFVQLANYNANGRWPELREAQTMTLALPHTGMAVITDIGEALDIHPRNKQDVGLRLALAALHDAYGHDVVPSGPLFAGCTVEGDAVRVRFTHAGGLTARGPLDGFVLASTDRVFHPATACLDGDTVVVTSAAVPAPVAVRYAWEDNPPCPLCNAAGLPASPFRSDDWAWGTATMPQAAAAAV
jgi:sialate O-acetylesterase